MNILVFRYNISFIDPPLGGFGVIFSEVMIFSEGFSPRKISSPNDKYTFLCEALKTRKESQKVKERGTISQ